MKLEGLVVKFLKPCNMHAEMNSCRIELYQMWNHGSSCTGVSTKAMHALKQLHNLATSQENLHNHCVIILHNLFLVDKVLNAYYVKLLAPPTIIHPLYSKKNKNGTVH